jgi:hypothetical protein
MGISLFIPGCGAGDERKTTGRDKRSQKYPYVKPDPDPDPDPDPFNGASKTMSEKLKESYLAVTQQPCQKICVAGSGMRRIIVHDRVF